MTDVHPMLKKRRVNTILVSVMNNRRGKDISLDEFLDKIGVSTTDAVDQQVKCEPEDVVVPEAPDNKILEDLFDYLDENLQS